MEPISKNTQGCQNLRVEIPTLINSDLKAERKKGSFDVEELTYILDGTAEKTLKRRKLEKAVFSDPLFKWPRTTGMNSDEELTDSLRRALRLVQLQGELGWTRDDMHDIVSHVLRRHPQHALQQHHAVFIPAIQHLATGEQQSKWLPLAHKYKVLGCYVQTEMGHDGNNSGQIGTRADFDPSRDEFSINTPTLSSVKRWSVSEASACTHAVIQARLVLNRKDHGIHEFIVPLRSLDDHSLLPGVHINKMADDTVNSCFLTFRHTRVPRKNMLMNNAEVTRRGEYIKTMSRRFTVGFSAALRLADMNIAVQSICSACTIAVRYNAFQRQQSITPSSPKPAESVQMLECRTHQNLIFPAVSAAYAVHFLRGFWTRRYQDLQFHMNQGCYADLVSFDILSSMTQAFCTDIASECIESCQRSCGVNGCLTSSGLPALLHSVTSVRTGNTASYRKTAIYLMKALADALSGETLSGETTYLNEDENAYVCPLHNGKDLRNLRYLCQIYNHRSHGLLLHTARKLQIAMETGLDQDVACDSVSVQLVQVAKVHCHAVAVRAFVESIEELDTDPQIIALLNRLCCLYALYGIVNCAGDFLETGAIHVGMMDIIREEVTKLLQELRPDVVSLMDSFDIRDEILNSDIGSYDGNVYERVYNTATPSQSEVHPAYYKYLRPLLADKTGLQSKL